MPYRSGFRPDLFADRAVVVTGGGSGIGRCVAHELVALGARVALVGRTRARLERVRGELEREGGTAHVFACDIRDEEGVTRTVTEALEALGRIDGLVNNAGGQFPALLRDLSLRAWNAVVANNLTGTFLFAREVHRQWMEAHGGSIVNVGADAHYGMPGMGHNGVARAGQENFTFTASVEWAASGVRVNHVVPGFIASSGLDAYPPSSADTLRGIRHRIPQKRLGNEAEVSAAVVFLLSPMAAYVNGASLRVDGGLHNDIGGFYRVPDHDRSPHWDGFHLSEPPRVLRGDDGEDRRREVPAKRDRS